MHSSSRPSSGDAGGAPRIHRSSSHPHPLTVDGAGPRRLSDAEDATEVTLLSQEHCTWCDDAKAVLDRVTRTYPVSLTVVDMASADGKELANRSGALFPPAILIDGELFCFGRLSERKLLRELDRRHGRELQ